MTDEQFIERLLELHSRGASGIAGMRELLRGQMARLLALAERGVQKTPRKSPVKQMPLPGLEFPDWWPHSAWAAYLAMRKKMKVSPTEHAVDLLVKTVTGLRSAGNDPAAALDRSTVNCWTDVYPLRGFTPTLVATPYEETNEKGWLRRLEMFYGVDGDEDSRVGTWSPRWGEKPETTGNRVPPMAWAAFHTQHPGRKNVS